MTHKEPQSDTDNEQTFASNEEGLLEATEQEVQLGEPDTEKEMADTGSSEWEIKYREMNDRFLRLYSEFDNYKKRNARERIEITKTAGADIISSLLPVLDDFDRASQVMEQTNDIEGVKEGVRLIHQKLRSVLNQKGLEETNALGEQFDMDVHEAITMIPAGNEEQKGKVVDVVEKGYSLNGKMIRFAKVVVGK